MDFNNSNYYGYSMPLQPQYPQQSNINVLDTVKGVFLSLINNPLLTCFYHVVGEEKGQLLFELDRYNIKYLNLFNLNYLLISPSDLENVKLLNKNVLLKAKNYVCLLNFDTLNQFVLSSQLPDKNLLTLHNINKYQLEMLRRRCQGISEGFVLGIKENKPGLFSVSVLNLFAVSPNAQDFCKSYLHSVMDLFGDTSTCLINGIDNEKNVNFAIIDIENSNAEDNNSCFMFGENPQYGYIYINNAGFQYHPYDYLRKCYAQNPSIKGIIGEVQYSYKLQKALNKIPFKYFAYSNEEFHNSLEYFESIKKEDKKIKKDRIQKDVQIFMCTANLVDKLDAMAKQKLSTLNINNTQQYFEHYCTETSNIINACIAGMSLTGYNDKDIGYLIDECTKRGITFNSYKDAPNVIKNTFVELHPAIVQQKQIYQGDMSYGSEYRT